jgi:hypothetical protein
MAEAASLCFFFSTQGLVGVHLAFSSAVNCLDNSSVLPEIQPCLCSLLGTEGNHSFMRLFSVAWA